MSFQDRSRTDVKNLLNLLRSTQDASASSSSSSKSTAHQPTTPSQSSRQNLDTYSPSKPSFSPRQPQPQSQSQSQSNSSSSAARDAGIQPTPLPPHFQSNFAPAEAPLPTQSQLDDLIQSLNRRPSAPNSGTGSASASTSTSAQAQSKSQSQSQRTAFEPFGPVGQNEEGKKEYDPQLSMRSFPVPSGKSAHTTPKDKDKDKGKAKERNSDGKGFRNMPFEEARKVVLDLINDPSFVAEVKKMKSDQDALERRLWAKQEKLKAQHQEHVNAEKQIAKLARKPITPAKTKEWASTLSSILEEFHRQSVLPAIDGLSLRQRKRLEELGVPGLGEDDGLETTKERAKKVLQVLMDGVKDKG